MPPGLLNFTALETRLRRICLKRVWSTTRLSISGVKEKTRFTFLWAIAEERTRRTASSSSFAAAYPTGGEALQLSEGDADGGVVRVP